METPRQIDRIREETDEAIENLVRKMDEFGEVQGKDPEEDNLSLSGKNILVVEDSVGKASKIISCILDYSDECFIEHAVTIDAADRFWRDREHEIVLLDLDLVDEKNIEQINNTFKNSYVLFIGSKEDMARVPVEGVQYRILTQEQLEKCPLDVHLKTSKLFSRNGYEKDLGDYFNG